MQGLGSLGEAGPQQACLMRAGVTENTAAVENAARGREGKKHPGFSCPLLSSLMSVPPMLGQLQPSWQGSLGKEPVGPAPL